MHVICADLSHVQARNQSFNVQTIFPTNLDDISALHLAARVSRLEGGNLFDGFIGSRKLATEY